MIYLSTGEVAKLYKKYIETTTDYIIGIGTIKNGLQKTTNPKF